MSDQRSPRPSTTAMQWIRRSSLGVAVAWVVAACSPAGSTPEVVPQQVQESPEPSPSASATRGAVPEPDRSPSRGTPAPTFTATPTPSSTPTPTPTVPPTPAELPVMLSAQYPEIEVSAPGVTVTAYYVLGTREALAQAQGIEVPFPEGDPRRAVCAVAEAVTVTTAPDVKIAVDSFKAAGKGPAMWGTAVPELPAAANGTVTHASRITDVGENPAPLDGGRMKLTLTNTDGATMPVTVEWGGGLITQLPNRGGLSPQEINCVVGSRTASLGD